MKKFINKIGFASLGLVLFMLFNFGMNSYFIKNQQTKVNGKVLLMGGSHINSGLNPLYIANSKNLATSGETYFDTFYKLKYLVKNPNNDIATVVFGFGYNNICGLNDDKYLKEAMSIKYIGRNYSIIPFNVLNSVGINKIGYLKTIIRRMCLYPSVIDEEFLGKGFNYRLPNLSMSDAAKRVKWHYYLNDKVRRESERDIKYLDSIINFANNNNIELIALNIPQRKEYYSAIPEDIKRKYNEIRKSLIKRDIRLIDLLEMELDSSSFANHDHLSYKGAKTISKIVSDSLSGWNLIVVSK